MLNILFLGDIVGSSGRTAIKKLLPGLKKEYKIDLCLANADNLTHGMGPTRDKLEEVITYGVDFFTCGDHVFRFKNFYSDLDDEKLPIIRPANYSSESPGRGFEVIDLGKKGQVLIINLIGQVFIRDNPNSPFSEIDKILKQYEEVHFTAKIVDIHAEATSEKRALGFYLDGRVSLVVGTHTHVPTADAEILPQGTGYITDLGMVGPKDSILGENIASVKEHYVRKTPHRYLLEEHGEMALNGLLATIGENGLAKKVKRIEAELAE